MELPSDAASADAGAMDVNATTAAVTTATAEDKATFKLFFFLSLLSSLFIFLSPFYE